LWFHQVVYPTINEVIKMTSGLKRRVERLILVSLLAVVALSHPTQAFAPIPAIPNSGPGYVPGEVVIGWEPASGVIPVSVWPAGLTNDRTSPEWQQAVTTLSLRTGLAVLDAQPEYGTARLAVPAGQEKVEIASLSALPWVKYAEPNYIAHAADPQGLRKPFGSQATYPNDPYFGDQWNLRRVGAPAAWDITLGSYSLVVAVIDSGVDSTHPEFAGRLARGYDYVNDDDVPNDDYGHGTHVTGILAAAANNATGVAGLAPNIKILPLKVLDANGYGTYANIATAIRRAVDSSAQVINLSLGGTYDSADIRNAINRAVERNVLVVAAAGNCALPVGQCSYQVNPDFYPAAYPGVVAVSASDRYDQRTPYSGYKPYVMLAAPGGVAEDQVWSTTVGGYAFNYGTSMATPLVSAAVALALTISPTLTLTQAANALRQTADQTGYDPATGAGLDYATGRNDYFGYGRLNVDRLLRWLYPPSLSASAAYQTFLLEPGEQKFYPVSLTNPSAQPVVWQAAVVEGGSWLSVFPASGATAFGAAGTLMMKANAAALTPGYYDGAVRVQYSGPAAGRRDIYLLLRVADDVRRTYLPLAPVRRTSIAWVDPTALGYPLNLTDNSARQLPLPFAFTFYGRTFTSIWVADDGVAFFGQPGTKALSSPGACLPTAAAPNNAIYALWADWQPNLGGQVYVYQPDNDRYIITWYQVRPAAGMSPQSFQAVLFRDGHLILQYLAIQSPPLGTIGLENYDGTVAEQITCATAGRNIVSGDVLSLRPDLPW
jgi:subtilisin family serine protease